MGNIDFTFSQLCIYRASAEQPNTKEGLKRCGRHDSLLFCVVIIDHAMYGLTQKKALKRCGTHGLNIKWKSKAWFCLLDYCLLAGSVALRECHAHPGVEDSLSRSTTSFGEGSVHRYLLWRIFAILRNVLAKTWKSSTLAFFWEKWGKFPIFAKIKIWKENHSLSPILTCPNHFFFIAIFLFFTIKLEFL